MSNRTPRLLVPILLLMALAIPALADAETRSPGHKYFTDVVLVDHEGKEHRLYSDLLRDRVVVISAMFTTCEGVCPVTMANLKKIQDWLGPRLGEDVILMSFTVDREHDSREALAEYAQTWEARPGWYFLSGEPENLDFALRKLGLYTEVKESHTPVFLVGKEETGLWKKALGLASARELIDIVKSVVEDDPQTAGDPVEAGG